MKLSRLYSNQPAKFGPIWFKDGLNVVLGEIRLPENKAKDTHNIGKSTLGQMLDFCFLSGKKDDFFLFKHIDRFKEFVFFLEIELRPGECLTIRRSVEEATRVSFKKHCIKGQDFTLLPEKDWDHTDVPFDKSREILDSLLDWRDFGEWSYRKGLSYLVRHQDDFQSVFHLKKFQSKHMDWKPFLAHILGFNSNNIKKHYLKEDELEALNKTLNTLRAELGPDLPSIGKIQSILLLKINEVEKRQALVDAFDFRNEDKLQNKELVDSVDTQIAELNSEKYYLTSNKKKISGSLNDGKILFDVTETEKLFQEAGVLFEGQLKKDFQQLIEFNRAITTERNKYLTEEVTAIDERIKAVTASLNDLGKKRSKALSYLSDGDSFTKYKDITNQIVELKADIQALENQKRILERLDSVKGGIRKLSDERDELQTLIETNVKEVNESKESTFSQIRVFFDEIVHEVIGRNAILSVTVNKEGHLEFKPEILDEKGNSTSADVGHTYKKFLCIAFDMALMRAHLNGKFPRFIFHDGVFESLDARKKENLIEVLRRYSSYGIQQIITLIDSDVSPDLLPSVKGENDEDVILLLHDEGPKGRLFRMASW